MSGLTAYLLGVVFAYLLILAIEWCWPEPKDRNPS